MLLLLPLMCLHIFTQLLLLLLLILLLPQILQLAVLEHHSTSAEIDRQTEVKDILKSNQR